MKREKKWQELQKQILKGKKKITANKQMKHHITSHHLLLLLTHTVLYNSSRIHLKIQRVTSARGEVLIKIVGEM